MHGVDRSFVLSLNVTVNVRFSSAIMYPCMYILKPNNSFCVYIKLQKFQVVKKNSSHVTTCDKWLEMVKTFSVKQRTKLNCGKSL